MVYTKNIKNHNVFYITIKNAFSVTNQHFRTISEGSCHTENCSDDAENSALLHRNKLHFIIY